MGHYESVLRGKFIALGVYIKEMEKSHMSNLTHLKALEQKEADSSRKSR